MLAENEQLKAKNAASHVMIEEMRVKIEQLQSENVALHKRLGSKVDIAPIHGCDEMYPSVLYCLHRMMPWRHWALTGGLQSDADDIETIEPDLDTRLAEAMQPHTYLHYGTGVAGGGEIWNVGNAQGKGVEACYRAVKAAKRCRYTRGEDDDDRGKYFTYVSRGDKNCGCKGSSAPLSVRRDGNADYYFIGAPPSSKSIQHARL